MTEKKQNQNDLILVETAKLAAQTIGLQKDMAIDFISMHNLSHRVIKEDGRFNMAATRDYKVNRINLVIEGSLVQEAYVG
jgi:alkylated DNA nucleotide flippase Atl1